MIYFLYTHPRIRLTLSSIALIISIFFESITFLFTIHQTKVFLILYFAFALIFIYHFGASVAPALIVAALAAFFVLSITANISRFIYLPMRAFHDIYSFSCTNTSPSHSECDRSQLPRVASPRFAPAASLVGKRVVLTDKIGPMAGHIVSQDADGVMFKGDDGLEQLIEHGELLSGEVHIVEFPARP